MQLLGLSLYLISKWFTSLFYPEHHFSFNFFFFQDTSMAFGRPGAGAPVRTKSGRLRSTVVGNPEIRLFSLLCQFYYLFYPPHEYISHRISSDSKPTKEFRNQSTTTSVTLRQPKRSHNTTQNSVSGKIFSLSLSSEYNKSSLHFHSLPCDEKNGHEQQRGIIQLS